MLLYWPILLSMAVKILIIDDHKIFIEALNALLKNENSIEVVGQTENSVNAIDLVEEKKPDVVVVDMAMPGINGIELTRQLRHRFSDIKVICLSIHTEPQFVRGMVNAGVSGYILKNIAFLELTHAIRSVHRGREFFSKEIHAFISQESDAIGKKPKGANLTAREKSVLSLIAEGNSNRKTASFLALSIHTVVRHRQNIMDKTGLRTIAELTGFAVRQGLITA